MGAFWLLSCFSALALLVLAALNGTSVATERGLPGYRNAASLSALGSSRTKNDAALFISPFGKRQIEIFNAEYKQIGSIAAPGGILALDGMGNLYDAKLTADTVQIYSPPYDGHYASVSLPPKEEVAGIAVDQLSGIFAILACQCADSGPDSIYFYRRNQTTPCNVVAPSNINQINSSATFDREGTLFFLAGSGTTLTIYSLSGGCQARTAVELSFKHPIYPYGTYGVTKDDSIVVQSFGSPTTRNDTNSPWPIYTYAHPVNGQFGDPLTTTVLRMYGNDKYKVEQMLALGSDGATLWGFSNLPSGVRLFRYPQGGGSIRTINTAPGGLAVFPPLVP